MNTLAKFVTVTGVILFSMSAQAATPGKAIDQKIQECSAKAVSTVDSEGCLQQGYADWDKELNNQYQALIKEQPAPVKKAIVQSQRNWLTYQKSYFAALDTYYQQQQGTVWGLVDAQAKLDFIRAKAIELNTMAGSVDVSGGNG